MAFLDEIQEKQRRLQRDVKAIQQALQEYKIRPIGKTVGLIIPEACRERLHIQMDIWEAESYRQIVNTCVVLGLDRLEEIGKIRGRPDKTNKSRKRSSTPPRPVVNRNLVKLKETVCDLEEEPRPEDENVIEELPELFGVEDQENEEIITPEETG